MQLNQPIKFDHDQYARSKADNDFWGQIRRTVNGKPVDEEQINLIIERILAKLSIENGDILLDLACGNGALSSRLFSRLTGYRGVDFSAKLIEVANKYFSQDNKFTFTHSGASEFIDVDSNPDRYTKVLCYGSFSYFREEHAANVLAKLYNQYRNVSRVFIGNLPDKDLAEEFYGKGKVNPAELLDNESPIGIWRSRENFVALAKKYGWNAEVSVMPEYYYAAHYRYDILLVR